jgi:2-methylcitrate dehydratase PrpD
MSSPAAARSVPSAQTTGTRGRQLTAFIASTTHRDFPPEVLEAAARALVDFIGCAVGASRDAPVLPVLPVIKAWNASGKARIFRGGRTTPALAVLANGTMTHAMDYDDTHPMGAGHPSGPCWSTALALAEEYGYSERQAIAAFIAGFEVMAKLGGGGPPGVGRSLQRRGFHPTSVFGRTGAAAVACSLMKLDEQRIAYALGIAATTAGGLVGSFGTHGKPFHAGKAAMDGILSAQLAAEGFISATHLYELEKGLLDAFIQNRETEVPPLDDFGVKWELLGNSFKPFARRRDHWRIASRAAGSPQYMRKYIRTRWLRRASWRRAPRWRVNSACRSAFRWRSAVIAWCRRILSMRPCAIRRWRDWCRW